MEAFRPSPATLRPCVQRTSGRGPGGLGLACTVTRAPQPSLLSSVSCKAKSGATGLTCLSPGRITPSDSGISSVTIRFQVAPGNDFRSSVNFGFIKPKLLSEADLISNNGKGESLHLSLPCSRGREESSLPSLDFYIHPKEAAYSSLSLQVLYIH